MGFFDKVNESLKVCGPGEKCPKPLDCQKGLVKEHGYCKSVPHDYETGVSSGDSPHHSSGPRDRDRMSYSYHNTSGQYSVFDINERNSSLRRIYKGANGLGGILITKKPIDNRSLDYQACTQYFTSSNGLHVYFFSNVGIKIAPFRRIPGAYEPFIAYHQALYYHEVDFMPMARRGLDHQGAALELFPGVGILTEQNHPIP